MDVIPCDISSTIYLGQPNNIPVNANCMQLQEPFEPELIEPGIVDQTVVFAFKTLIKRYKKQMGDTKDISIVTGGLQQYLNKKALKKTEKTDDTHQEDSLFHSLPVSFNTM